MEYSNLIDTIKIKGKCRLTKGGGSLFQYCDWVRDNNKGAVKFPLPIDNTKYRHGRDTVAELVMSQNLNGEAKVYTHKDFIGEYGYGIFIQNIPYWLLHNYNGALGKQRQKRVSSGHPVWVEIAIPSVKDLFQMPTFVDYMTTKATSSKISEMLWGYVTSMHDFGRYGIEAYDIAEPLDKDNLPILQLDICKDMSGTLVKDVFELVGMNGYYARKNMRLWRNTTADDTSGVTTYMDTNGIEFRKGKKSSEIYKFYDKDLQIAQSYKDSFMPIYTANDVKRQTAADIVESMEKAERTRLRYEVSLRRVPSVRDAINKKFAEGDDIRNVKFSNVFDDTIYSRTPERILRDGLLSIFGGEVAKDVELLYDRSKSMTDTELLQSKKTKGLKYLGIQYLLDKGMTNDQLWPYLYQKAGMSYEVVRRLRNEMRENGILEKLNDNHRRTMDAFRGMYKDLDTAVQ